MLQSMHFENFALFRRADFTFDGSFCAITGETGAGKTLLLEGIRLLCGNRANPDLVRHGEKVCTLTAVFSNLKPHRLSGLEEWGIFPDSEDGNIYVTRTLFSDGKSKATIHGRPVSLTTLKEAVGCMMEIQERGDNQSLCREEKHIEFLTRFARCEEEVEAYRASYKAYQQADALYKDRRRALKEAEEKKEWWEIQRNDILLAGLKEGEEETLLARKEVLSHAADIHGAVVLALNALGGDGGEGAVDKAFRAHSALETLDGKIDGMADVLTRINDAAYELDAIRDELRDIKEESDIDPEAALTMIQERLFTIEQMKRRYGGTVATALAYFEEINDKIKLAEDGESGLEYLKKERIIAYKEAVAKGEILSQKRKEAAARLCDALHRELSELDLENMRFSVHVEAVYTEIPARENRKASRLITLQEDGIDRVSFRVTANMGESEKSLADTASTGESARLMLALRSVLALSDDKDTLIFDEIDSGVSGKSAKKIGETLKRLSNDLQIICITHSAQVASSADTHLVIAKSATPDGRTESTVTPLTREQRVGELARILGGLTITSASIANAKELLNAQKKA
jgi:DNA repair protein RecN (Recombination protein N)